MKTLVIGVLVLAVSLPGVAYPGTLAEWFTKPGGSPPVIIHSFASEKLSHGDTWRIYLEAKDPDGDMREIVYTVGGAWAGGRVNYIRIKKGKRADLVGYLECFTSSPATAVADWTALTLTLYIRDKRGNASEKVVFSVALTRGVKQASPPSPFDVAGLKSLGTISVRLFLPLGDL
jgi:hypothetical protein